MAFDAGVGAPTGSPSGNNPPAPTPTARPGAPGPGAVAFTPPLTSGPPGGQYDLLSEVPPTGTYSADIPQDTGTARGGAKTDIVPVEAPGIAPPPPVGIPFDSIHAPLSGEASGTVYAQDVTCWSVLPGGSLAQVVPSVYPGPVTGSVDKGSDFDMLAPVEAGTAVGVPYTPPDTGTKGGPPGGPPAPEPEPGFPPVLDSLPPAQPVYGTIEATQVNGDPKNRTQITLNFVAPTKSQPTSGEYLGDATGASQNLLTEYSPLSPGDFSVYEVTGLTGGGGSTTLSVAADEGDFDLTVTSPTNFTVNSWVEVEEGAQKEYGQIQAINGSVLTLFNPLIEGTWTTSATVKNVDVLLKTETTDYTVTLATGDFALIAGQFTASNPVFSVYQQAISDLGGYELYRIPGNLTYDDGVHYDEITTDGGVVTVDASIGALATSSQEILGSAEGATDHTYYLFSRDAEGNISRGQAVFIETIPSVVQNLSQQVEQNGVVLSWDPITETNFSGVNVYRCLGGTFTPATAVKVNSIPVMGTSFEDGSDNVTTRRTPGEVPYPASSTTYSYAVEAEDTVSSWSTGTQNQSADPLKSAVLTATKTD